MPSAEHSVVRVLDVLLVTVPGQLTDDDIDGLQEEILTAMEDEQPRAVVLDISAVRTMDSFFARVLAETADMIDLMGGRTIVVGMRPSIAITTAQLGFDLGSIETARNTDHALERLDVRVDEDPDGESEPAETADVAPKRGEGLLIDGER
jgi:rsbT antagonist protein RsbS